MHANRKEYSTDPFDEVSDESVISVNQSSPPTYSMLGSTILPSSLNTPNQSRANTPGPTNSGWTQVQLPVLVQGSGLSQVEFKYPIGYIIFHSIFLIILSLAQISVQFLLYLKYESLKFDLGGT
jgi:hypothetical protein